MALLRRMLSCFIVLLFSKCYAPCAKHFSQNRVFVISIWCHVLVCMCAAFSVAAVVCVWVQFSLVACQRSSLHLCVSQPVVVAGLRSQQLFFTSVVVSQSLFACVSVCLLLRADLRSHLQSTVFPPQWCHFGQFACSSYRLKVSTARCLCWAWCQFVAPVAWASEYSYALWRPSLVS